MKKANDHVFYGTLRECTDELWKKIDFKHNVFPRFDYAAVVIEDAETARKAYKTAESWFGCDDFGDEFDCDTITLMFAHYGGGGIECMEMERDETEEKLKEIFMQRIGSSTDKCGLGVLEPNDYTVFELR